jgi:hypothetical protein
LKRLFIRGVARLQTNRKVLQESDTKVMLNLVVNLMRDVKQPRSEYAFTAGNRLQSLDFHRSSQSTSGVALNE